jgi:hypothetical protein
MCRSCEWASNGYRAPRRDGGETCGRLVGGGIAGAVRARTAVGAAGWAWGAEGFGAEGSPGRYTD